MFLGILVILPEFFRNLKGLGRIPLDLQGFARYSWDLGRFLWIWKNFLVFGKIFLRFGRICKVFGWFGKIFLDLERFGRVGKDLEAFLGIWKGFLWIWKEASWCTRGVGYWCTISMLLQQLHENRPEISSRFPHPKKLISNTKFSPKN